MFCRSYIHGLLLIVGITLVGCTTVQKGETVVVESDVKGTPTTQALQRLTGKHVDVWPTVDISGRNAEVLAAVRRFFDEKMQRLAADEQTYWIAEEYNQFSREYSEIRYAEYNGNAEAVSMPTVLRIAATAPEDTDRLVTLRWARVDSTGTPADVRYVFTFLAKAERQGSYRLASPLPWLTRNYERRQVGRVSYRLSPKHVFSNKDATEQQEALTVLDEFFQLEPFPITFYSFKEPVELFQARGYEVHPLAYVHASGGQAGVGDVLYAANDSDKYTHEVVHLYLNRAYPKSTGLLNEGLATLLGGSSGRTYEWHAQQVHTWLVDNPQADLTGYLNPYEQKFINDDTSLPYVIGAVLCKYLLEDHGRAALDEALDAGKDCWPVLNRYGITKEGLRNSLIDVLSSQ